MGYYLIPMQARQDEYDGKDGITSNAVSLSLAGGLGTLFKFLNGSARVSSSKTKRVNLDPRTVKESNLANLALASKLMQPGQKSNSELVELTAEVNKYRNHAGQVTKTIDSIQNALARRNYTRRKTGRKEKKKKNKNK